MLRIVFRLLFTTLICTCVLAKMVGQQRLRIEYYTVNDGLSAREINDFHLGDDGFLWVGTADGLNRFDGQAFTRFGLSVKTKENLSNSSVERIAVDNEGQFILTFRDFFGYFDRFDPVTKEVEQVELVPSAGVVGFPRAIATDAYGRTFVVTVGSEGTFIYEYTPNQGDEQQQFTAIYHDTDGAWKSWTPRVDLLPLSNGQLLLYDDEHGFRHLSATGKLLSTPFQKTAINRRPYTFAEAPDGSVYFSFRNGIPLYRWEPGPNSPATPVAKSDYDLRYPRIHRDGKGQLLLQATEDFLGDAFPAEYYLIDVTGRFQLFEKRLPTARAVTAAIALDFNETTYLGLREGLGVIERYTNSVQTYLTAPEENKLERNVLRGICQDIEGNVYVIEEDGQIYVLPPGAEAPTPVPLRSALDSTQEVAFRAGAGLIYDREYNALWATAQLPDRAKGGMLIQYDLDTRLARVYYSRYALGAIGQDGRGRTYVAGADARQKGLLLEFSEPERRFVPVRVGLFPVSTLSGFRINAIVPASDGSLLLTTDTKGLIKVTPSTQRVQYLTVDGEEEEVPSVGEEAYSVYEGEDAYWLGTEQGLSRVPKEPAEPITQFTRGDGLSSNVIYGIVADPSQGLWVSSNDGLTYLPPGYQPDNFRRYYREDGLANDEFTPLSAYVDREGRFYFGGVNGLTAFQEGDFAVNASGAEVLLTDVTVYGRNESRSINTDLEDLKQVTVSASEKSVAISFALPVGHLPSATQFRYRLDGFNDEWIPLTNERTVRFNNLASGDYLLHIQGAGANGNFGHEERQLTINVRQYIYEHLWFQILIILAFAGMIIWIFQSKLHERLRNEKLRTQLSSDIHDEVSGLLAGITLQAELLKGRTDDATMQSKLDRVGEAGRAAMSKMSDVIWSIDSRRDTIGNLLQRMQEHADEVLLPIDIRYDFTDKGVDAKRQLSGNIRQDLYFIYKEAINNIARHSNATKVDIELTQSGQVFELFIRDNGYKEVDIIEQGGGAADVKARATHRVRREKTGQGKDNMRMRAGRLGGELTIDDREGYTLVLRMRRL